jgi:outer membrane protein
MPSYFRAAPVAMLMMITGAGTVAAQTGQKIGYVRSSLLLEQAPGRADAEAQFEKETGTYRAQIKRMSDSLNTMVAAFEKAAPSLSVTARDARGKELQGRQGDYERRTRELEQRAQARQQEQVQPILDRVKASIEEVRVEGGYSFIFNIDQGSPILAADKNLEITEKVLMKLRATAASARPASSLPAAAPAGVTRPAIPPRD